MITFETIRKIMPNTTRGAVFAGPLERALVEFHLEDREQVARFLANVGHETRELSVFEEELNYSPERLMTVWPHRFPTLASTSGYARNPVALANKVYGGRMGNGDEKSGDGWRFRGSGMLQITGRDNQAAVAKRFNLPIEHVGDWLRTPEGAARAAVWWYVSQGLAKLDTFDHVCDRINIGRMTDKVGDSLGWSDRLQLYNRALEAL